MRFDYLTITRSSVITINYLLDNQKFKLYKSSGLLCGTSGASIGGKCSFDAIGNYPNPPYDKLIITDTDGVTPLYTYINTGNIYPGDVYNAVALTALGINWNPYPPVYQTPKVYITTSNKTYNKIITGEVSPSAANTLGIFRLVIPDPNRDEEKNFGNLEKVRIYGSFGNSNQLLIRGIVERLMPVRLKGGLWGLEVSGRDYGAFLDKRGNPLSVTYANREISDIIKNTTDGIFQYVPEVQFGNYVLFTNTTLNNWTYFAGRPAWDAVKELAILASKSTGSSQWGVYVCNGQHAGEYGKPNLHLQPIVTSLNLLPISTLNTFRTLGPKDWRQIITQTRIRYSVDGTLTNLAFVTVDAAGPGQLSNYALNFDGSTKWAKTGSLPGLSIS